MERLFTKSTQGSAAASAAGLQARLQGAVITPQDEGYEAARRAWNLTVDQQPAVIVMPQNAKDVSEAVRFANAQGLDIAIQATGHGVARPADGSLLVLTSQLKDLRIDPEAGTAWIGAGVKWGSVLARAQEYGLAPLLGSSPDVGAVGYTLGGGMGWLARKYGLSIDSVNYFELVTANGRRLRASLVENEDLFWGLRGGGGNFGIVLGMEVRLYPISRVYAGNLVYPLEGAEEVFRHYRQWITSAPDELTSSIVVMNFPPVPEVPEFLRGKSVAMVRGCYCGPIEQGESLLKFWRDWRAPIIDDFKEIPFSQAATISNDPLDPSPSASTGAWLGDLDDEVLAALVRYGAPQDGPTPLMVTEVRHAGGAIARVDPDSNAYSHREVLHSLQFIGMTPTPEARQAFADHTSRFKTALQPHLTGGVYMNFLEGSETRRRSRDGFAPEAYRRLAALKAKYDPENRFSHSFDLLG